MHALVSARCCQAPVPVFAEMSCPPEISQILATHITSTVCNQRRSNSHLQRCCNLLQGDMQQVVLLEAASRAQELRWVDVCPGARLQVVLLLLPPVAVVQAAHVHPVEVPDVLREVCPPLHCALRHGFLMWRLHHGARISSYAQRLQGEVSAQDLASRVASLRLHLLQRSRQLDCAPLMCRTAS